MPPRGAVRPVERHRLAPRLQPYRTWSNDTYRDTLLQLKAALKDASKIPRFCMSLPTKPRHTRSYNIRHREAPSRPLRRRAALKLARRVALVPSPLRWSYLPGKLVALGKFKPQLELSSGYAKAVR